MKKSIARIQSIRVFALAGVLSLSSTAFAQFVNGDFETGTLSGWTQGSGYLITDQLTDNLNPNSFMAGGAQYDASANGSDIVTAGFDPNTFNHLNRVYSGNYSIRVNDESNNGSVSVIKQTVTDYTDSHIFFAWAAVLEQSHGPTDSDVFQLTLRDDTTSSIIYSVTYNSASADTASLFTETPSGWFYTDWQIQNLDVSALRGDTFTLSLLAADCPYGGHAGYAYLDGFGAEIPISGPTGDPGAVPEPSTYGLMGAAVLMGVVAWRRKFGMGKGSR